MIHNAGSPFETLSSRIVWQCPWYRVRQDQIRLPGGGNGEYNVVEHAGAVWVVPVTSDGRIVLIYHFRYTVEDWCWELPAGGLTAGDAPLDVAVKELREEVGGTAARWQEIGWFYTSNGISNEKAHVFLAAGVTLGDTDHEDAEVMTVHCLSVSQALHMARSGQMTDGPSALALLLSEPHLLR